MRRKFNQSLVFQMGTILGSVLTLLIFTLVSLHVVAGRYNEEILQDKKEKLEVAGQSLQRGLVSQLEKGTSAELIKTYFEEQAGRLTESNPRVVVALSLPRLGSNLIFSQPVQGEKYIFFPPPGRPPGEPGFFGIKPEELQQPRTVVRDGPGGVLIASAYPISARGQRQGTLLVVERVQEGFNLVRTGIRIVSILIPLSALIGVLATFWLLNRMKQRVREITAGLEQLSQDSSYRLPVKGNDELGEIAAAINQLANAVEEKKLLEEQLAQSDRLAALGRLVAGVAHEIRNPLGIMKTTLQVMREEFADQRELQEYLQVLQEQVERQNKTVQEFLAYARPVPPVIQPLNVNTVIDSVLYLAGPYIQRQQVMVKTALEPELPRVAGDGEKLKQVFLNLVLNAVEAMPDGGELNISSYQEENWVIVQFADTGPGIAEEDLTRVFEPFYTTKPGGMGLGLALAYKMIEQQRGLIEVKSSRGAGTIFRVKLPLAGQRGC
ncbi:sensor histidine kinase [Carboxydocella sp. JDF658]|uniref:sensor histidine kinase n=1 Tax=Carboxydocella sp. JDF658 TaxID=1926600 RepID=UPI0009AD9DF4|nr:ATP-binding protein [Carboxydocella sp. JDF658]GAW31091.1 two-component sensor histidine kinase [Carboxydocella sp. JDF658]